MNLTHKFWFQEKVVQNYLTNAIDTSGAQRERQKLDQLVVGDALGLNCSRAFGTVRKGRSD